MRKGGIHLTFLRKKGVVGVDPHIEARGVWAWPPPEEDGEACAWHPPVTED